MELSYKILKGFERNNFGSERFNDVYYCNYTNISDANLLMFAIFNLHKHKIINSQSLNDYCKQFKNNTLIRKINTKYCKKLDRWYIDACSSAYILDMYNELCPKNNFNLIELVPYINRIYNKSFNKCIYYIYNYYIIPIIDKTFYNTEYLDVYNDLNIETIPTFESVEHNLSSGYCCKDCDGCLSEYKSSRYKMYYLKNIDNYYNKAKLKLQNYLKTAVKK